MNRKKVFGLIAAIIILIGILMVPVPEGLNVAGRNTLGILIAALVMWITEAIPIAITALLLLILQPIYGIANLETAFNEFITPVIFFVIATTGISSAIIKTPLAARMARWLLKRAENDSGKVILAFTTGTAMASTFISNVPATAIFLGLAMSILDTIGAKPGKSRLGKALMIAIPFGAVVGGMATPAGSSINILTLYLLEKYTQIRISFLEWMVFGIPLTVLMVPTITYVIVRIFKPEPINIDILTVISEGEILQKSFTRIEKKVLIIISIMMFLWVISTWIPAINITTVAIAGLAAFFLPGIDVFTWDEFNAEVGWDIIVLIGSVTSIGAAVVSVGLSTWFMNAVLWGLAGLGIVPLTALIGLIVNLLHLILPIPPAIVTVSIQPFADLANVVGVSPVIFAIVTCFLSGCVMLLPLDSVPLLTYNKKFYTMWDMFKTGIITSTVWIVLAAVWVPLAALLLGY